MILFENVAKRYKGTKKPALDGVSFNVGRGEFVFLVGASGSGKSSCLRIILREERATSGQVHVLGQDLRKISARKVPYFRRNLGVVFQDFRLLANKTVFDNVAFSLQVIGKSRGFIQEAVPDVLDMVGLAEKAKRLPHELSGGEQQRVAIARAIVNKPKVLLADEPTGNLDPATSLGIMQLLRAINAAGTTIIMATHEAVFVDIMQQRVIELSQGTVVRDEISGGYGTTAAIPTDHDEDGRQQVLRASEEAVRAALAPNAPVDVPLPGSTELLVHAAPEDVGATDEPTNPRLGADLAAYAATIAAPRPAEGEDTPATEPVRERAEPDPIGVETRERAIPRFLQPAEPFDPVDIVESGGFAKRLGLEQDDDEPDVGSVR